MDVEARRRLAGRIHFASGTFALTTAALAAEAVTTSWEPSRYVAGLLLFTIGAAFWAATQPERGVGGAP